jgi:hypothetical protein
LSHSINLLSESIIEPAGLVFDEGAHGPCAQTKIEQIDGPRPARVGQALELIPEEETHAHVQ